MSKRPGTWTVLLFVVLIVLSTTSLSVGAVRFPMDDAVRILLDAQDPLHVVVFDVRLPRTLVALCVGAALACSGALLQTVVRNPLADPALLGVSAGAGVGALIGILFHPNSAAWLPAFAFAGAAIALAGVLGASFVGNVRAEPLRIILSGAAMQAILFSVVSLLMFLFAERAPAFIAFTVGSLASVGWTELRIVALPVLAGLIVVWTLASSLDVMLLDDDTARGLGVPVTVLRIGACGLASLLAAAAVSVAGLVGFVGLVVPNMLRLAVGPKHGSLLPLTALGGGVLVLGADLVARTVAAPVELPLGSFLALIGGPTLQMLLWRRR